MIQCKILVEEDENGSLIVIAHHSYVLEQNSRDESETSCQDSLFEQF